MKKMMFAVFAALIGLSASAAAYDWTMTKGTVYDGASTPTAINGTAYLYDAAVLSQADAVTAFYAGTFTTDTAVKSATMTAGKVATTDAFTYDGATSDWTAYFVVLNGDNIYISTSQAVAYSELGQGSITWATSQAAPSKSLSEGVSYAGAGWYTAGGTSTPEPTSGLLLLLGMAGLALKRKIA